MLVRPWTTDNWEVLHTQIEALLLGCGCSISGWARLQQGQDTVGISPEVSGRCQEPVIDLGNSLNHILTAQLHMSHTSAQLPSKHPMLSTDNVHVVHVDHQA